jgi:lipopolysaccharide export system protein LptA
MTTFSGASRYNASKIRALMKKPAAALLAALCGVLFTAPVLAEKADRDKPMNVEADALRYDDLRQTSVFTGKVVITKGTIVIRGAKVDVRQDPEGYQYGVVTAEPGKLAYYKQKREGMDEYMEGEADVIEYDGKADRVKFIRHADLRRLRGATVSDEMTGSLITYDNGTDVFTVDGGPGSPATAPGATPGRIRAVLSPRTTASAATPAAAPPARLRQSTTIGGEKK